MVDIQPIKYKDQQKTSSNRRNIVPYGQRVECRCQNFNRKLI